MSPSASRLPARPSLEQLRKQAKDLLRDFRDGDTAAVERFRAIDRRFADPANTSSPGLAQAQFVLAREYGFDTWATLADHVDALTALADHEYARMADIIAHAYSAGDPLPIRALNAKYATSFPWDREPEKMQQRLATWFASTARAMDQAVADARLLVARHAGVDTWDELAHNIAEHRAPAAGRTGAGRAFYTINEAHGTLETHGPVSDAEWDDVFALLAERTLTGLRAGGQMTDAALARLARIEHLTFLDIGGSNGVTDEGLQHVARLTRLEALHLGGWDSHITDRGLRALAPLGALRDFRMGWHRGLTDEGTLFLAGCSKLENINLMGTRTGDGTIAVLGEKEQLRTLRLGSAVTARGLPALQQIPCFREWRGGQATYTMMGFEAGPTMLMIPQRPVAHGGLEALAGLDGLVGLNLFGMGDNGGHELTGAAAAPLARLARLGFLACDPSDGAMQQIASIPSLRMLSCQDSHASDAGFTALGASRSLEYIWGRDSRGLGATGFAGLSRIPTLRGLATNLAYVGDAGLALLPAFPVLRELMPMGLTDDAFRHVAQCAHLEELWLMYCPETGDASTERITSLHNLRTYYAGGNTITDRSLELLGTMQSLEDIRLADVLGVTDTGIAALATLPRLRHLLLEAVPGVSRASLKAFGKGVDIKHGW